MANYRLPLSDFWAINFFTLKVPKKCQPILVTLLIMLEKDTPIIVRPDVKMRPYPAIHP